jgi:hypothetical protein
VLRRVSYKTPSPDLARRVAVALDLPPDYFPEYREGFVIGKTCTQPRGAGFDGDASFATPFFCRSRSPSVSARRLPSPRRGLAMT